MSKVLILGAGMVVKPIADYLLDAGIDLTIASRTMSKAEALINNRANGKAVQWEVDDESTLESLIIENDLTVSLLPYTFHVKVAKLCIKHKKNMVTTSYVSPEMQALSEEAKEAGIIILNEIGVDPGYDHMTAMRIIDRVHEEGGQIEEFHSLCGALAAPEFVDNPFKYKFSWSPKGVVMAGNNDARYLKNGNETYIETKDLFKNPLQIDFPEVGNMEVYPNRNSLPYIDIYGIPEVKTMFRGTFRYDKWCASFDALKALNLTSYDELNVEGFSYSDLVAKVAGFDSTENLAQQIADRLSISLDSDALTAIKWLGLLNSDNMNRSKASSFDVTSDLMLEKMMLEDGAKDMVIMQHIFTIKNKFGETEVIKSSLLDFGDHNYTSIAKTVAYPAAIGVMMILNQKITSTGVHIPIVKDIYEPILNELETLGIAMKETYGLPVSEKVS